MAIVPLPQTHRYVYTGPASVGDSSLCCLLPEMTKVIPGGVKVYFVHPIKPCTRNSLI